MGGKMSGEMVRAFREGFGPLLEAGRLKTLLAQFRYDFADGLGAREHLERIAEGFGGVFDLVVEVRHKSWQKAGALRFFGGGLV